MNRIDVFKTVNILALVSLIAFTIFSTQWLLWIAVILLLGNAMESRITTLIAEYWMKFAAILGNFNSKIILSLLFFVVLTPIAFVYRLLNRDLVAHFRLNVRQSYFDDIGKSYVKSDFEKIW